MSDDISFCLDPCENKSCERHPSNIKIPNRLHSYMSFEGTEFCKKRSGRMTREEAISNLRNMMDGMPFDKCSDWIDACSVAIKSLEAWDEVLHEIGSIGLAWEYGRGVFDCYNIIKKHLEEVEE